MNLPLTLPHDWFPRSLPANFELGARSWCYSSFCCLHCHSRRPTGVRIGHDSGIYHGTFFNLGPDGEVEIGDYCTVVGGIFCTNKRIVVHDYAFIAHEVVLADTAFTTPCQIEPTCCSQVGTKSQPSIVVGENSWIGARAVLLAGAVIGEGAIVGAAAVVDFEVPPYAIAAGNPAQLVGSIQRPCYTHAPK